MARLARNLLREDRHILADVLNHRAVTCRLDWGRIRETESCLFLHILAKGFSFDFQPDCEYTLENIR